MPEWRNRDTQRARDLRNNATPAERMLWKHLSTSQTGYKFSRQMPIGPFYPDFLCRNAKVVIELDGDTHAATGEADAKRTAYLEQLGYVVLRFGNADVMGNVEGVVAMIVQALADRPTPIPSRLREGGE